MINNHIPKGCRPRTLAALLIVLSLALAGLVCPPAALAAPPQTSIGQTVYIPAYTYAIYSEKGKRFKLTTTLIIHNTDPERSLELISIKYFDGKGKLVKEYTAEPLKLAKLEALELLVKKPPLQQGSGASFLVVWRAEQAVSSPLMECIMIGSQGQQGISYRSTGQVVR